ncbi:hypothetical protein V8E51_002372 [Hyaloscypha variabilis]
MLRDVTSHPADHSMVFISNLILQPCDPRTLPSVDAIMAVQLQITLPLDWASDFDQVAERWYFFHRPSGYCQYLLPKSGDEVTRAAELVPRLPARPVNNVQSSTTTNGATYTGGGMGQSTVTSVVVQQTQSNAPTRTTSQVLQREVSSLQQTQQAQLEGGNTQSGPTSAGPALQRPSGSITRKPLRKPLPRQSSAPVQQQSQTPVAQRQDSQISPRTSISQESISGHMGQSQETLVASPRSSMSGTSIAEVQMQQAQQQHMGSSRSSISQTSTQDSLLQQSNPQSIYSPRSSISQNSVLEVPLQRTVSEPIPPHQSYNPQYASPVVQSPGITPIPEWTDTPVESGPSASFKNQGVSSWAEEFEESPRSTTQFHSPWSSSSRPKLANRLSTSAISLTKKSIEVSKKSYEASKGYVKAHPGKTTAIAGGIVGGIGVVASACGADGLSDAVAASKVYLNVKRAQQRKRVSHGAHHGQPQHAPATTAPNSVSSPVTHGPSAQEVAHELFKIMQQQGQLPTPGQNPALQNNSGQFPNQATPPNPQFPAQQYFPQQYTQPQLVPQPLFVQSSPSTTNPLFTFPSAQALPQPPSPSILAYQPPSPTSSIPLNALTLSQSPTPPLSLSGPPSPTFLPLNTLAITPDQSTLTYDQFLQEQTSTAIANQAILNSQAFTTSLTGQDMFVPGDLAAMPVPGDDGDYSDGGGGSDCGDGYSF